MNATRLFFVLGSVFSFFGVTLGAFAAHILKSKLSPEMFNIFEVGVRYQIYHAFALFIVSWASSEWNQTNFTLSGWSFVSGILLFSGSLYALSLSGIKGFGAITPLGGILFLWGWLTLFWKVYRA